MWAALSSTNRTVLDVGGRWDSRSSWASCICDMAGDGAWESGVLNRMAVARLSGLEVRSENE